VRPSRRVAKQKMHIRAPKDFWSGLMFLAFAAVAMLTARGYSLGTAGRMGPGYFPMLLGIVLAVLGLVLVVRSLVISGGPEQEGVARLHLVPLIVITVSVCLFGLAIERLGLVASVLIVIVVSAFASRESRILETCALALVLAAFSVGVFVYALQLSLPLWPAL
jgi:putative tricarboxylic transport membrane protein